MDMTRTSSSLNSQSMGTKDICIMMVHDDPMHQNIIFEMLQNCSKYKVLKFQGMVDALNTLRERKDRLDMVITDVKRSNSYGFEILYYIQKEFKIPAISMNTHENAKAVSVGLSSSAKLYFVKSLSGNEFRTLWHQAYTKERAKGTGFQRTLIIHEREDTGLERESLIQEVRQSDQWHKREAIEDKQSEEHKDHFPKGKKPRLMWDEQLHRKFVKVVELLGHDKAHPRHVVELMNVPGLTRQHVSSHLQKYRLQVKRFPEEMKSTRSVLRISSPPPGYSKSSPIYTPYQSKWNTAFNFSCPETSASRLNFGDKKSIVGNNNESLKSTFDINNCLISKTVNNTSFINNYCLVSETVKETSPFNDSCLVSKTEYNMSSTNIPMPLSNFYNPHHSEISTHTSNLVYQEKFLSSDTHNSSILVPENPQTYSSNNTTYVGFKLTSNGISFGCGNNNSAQSNNNGTTDDPSFSYEGKGNESLAQYPSTELNNNGEQQFDWPLAGDEIEDLLEEFWGEATNPSSLFD